MRRSKRVLLAAAVGLLLPLGITTTPAFAGKSVSAPITESCRSGQTTTSVQFELTDVPKWQKITVRTENGSLTRDHDSFESTAPTRGTARYDIALDSKLTGAPATAYISDDAWTGEFRMTGVSCRSPVAPQVSGEGSACGNEPQVSVQVTNPNPVTVTYQVGGHLPAQSAEVRGGQSESLIFGQVQRGRGYRVTAQGNDGTLGSTWVNVPSCIGTTVEPSNPTQPPVAPALTPGTPTSAPSTASVSATPSPRVTTSGSPVPEMEVGVDPFAPLLQAEARKSVTTLTPVNRKKELLTNNLTVVFAFFLGLAFVGITLLLRRRPYTGRKG